MAIGLFGAFALTRIGRGRCCCAFVYFVPYIVASVVTSGSEEPALTGPRHRNGCCTSTCWANIHLSTAGGGDREQLGVVGLSRRGLPRRDAGRQPELYEAAALDGAGTFGQFWHVTLPSIRPTFLFSG